MERGSRRKEKTYQFSAIILLRSSRASERRRIIIGQERFSVCLLFKHKYWPRLHVTASPCSVLQATRKRTQLLSAPRPLSSFNLLRTLTGSNTALKQACVIKSCSEIFLHPPFFFLPLSFFFLPLQFDAGRGWQAHCPVPEFPLYPTSTLHNDKTFSWMNLNLLFPKSKQKRK